LLTLCHDLLIFGASTRAAAFSALRCGMNPRCADYFADRDLAAVCPVERIDPQYAGRQFTELAETLAPTPWIYTGGFENHPEWVEHISSRHSLWGVDAGTLRAVRDPTRVADVLARRDIPCPAVRGDIVDTPRDAHWLKKPLASGGGRGIEAATCQSGRASPSHYFQERIDGPSFSALFMGQRSQARLIGVTRQLIGIDGSPFAYVGSVGPVPLAPALAARVRSLGDALACGFGLAGWFGVDFILRDGIPWPVEINPRYTASVEIHELAWGRSLLAEHRAVCQSSAGRAGTRSRMDITPARVIAKWVLHAPRRLVASEVVPDENEPDDLLAVRSIADVPWPETCFEPGEPVMTLMAEGAVPAECRSRMIGLVRRWTTRLGIECDLLNTSAFSPHCWLSGHDDVLDV
jgi:uncharacterized protein